MLFDDPVPFEEALQSRKVKALLPTTLGSTELRDIEPDLRERAMFSARTSNASYLQEIDDALERLLNPGQTQREDRITEENPEGNVTAGINITQARVALKEKLEEIDYRPEQGEEGGIKDLGSDQRLNLVLETNANMAAGYGQFAQMQDPEILDEFPVQELYRLEGRKEPREWLERWDEVGGELFDGRMIAKVDDEIWLRLGNDFDDSLGNPYPPFAFNSGMDVQPIDRAEAEDLGVIERGEAAPEPQNRGFNETLESTPEVRSEALRAALLESIGPEYVFQGDTLTRTGDRANEDNCGTGAGGFQPGNKCQVGGHGGGKQPSERAARALATYKPSTKAKQDRGEANEARIARMVKGTSLDDNEAMDVIVGNRAHGIEVKTFTDNGNDKITMHPESRERKEAWAKEHGATLHTVLVDSRNDFAGGKYRSQYSGHQIYYARGIGSFRIGSMTAVKDAGHLRQLMGLK